jgi:hypothetical protein
MCTIKVLALASLIPPKNAEVNDIGTKLVFTDGQPTVWGKINVYISSRKKLASNAA